MRHPLALATAVLLVPAVASAEPTRNYRCINSSDATVVYFRIGADELRERNRDGTWRENICRQADAFCANEDDGYIVEGPGGLYLNYKFRGGGFDFNSTATGELSGVCLPIQGEPPKW